MEYTIRNLTTNEENLTSAESTIRDADMAREMSEYTRHSVLTQAAQAMLAQANQNSSGILSLLQ
jgi:flagellin